MKNRHIHISNAQRWLDRLRRNTYQYSEFIGYIRGEVRNGNLTLADIGTSEEELEELRVERYKIAARIWLDLLREGTYHSSEFIGYIRGEVRNGNLTLADIGTSEEELALFAKGSA